MTGKKVHRLLFMEYAGPDKWGKASWFCECECGKKITASAILVTRGDVRSCGCLQAQRRIETKTKHGMFGTPEYAAWNGMKFRCYNPKSIGYPRYGKRGIVVCDEWRDSFEAFYKDMGDRPSPQHSIERKDNDGPYCKNNCMWATRKEQANNQSNNVFVEIDGRKFSPAEISEVANVRYGTVMSRIYGGWMGMDLLQPRGFRRTKS